ncbi:MAG: BACON domain-containing protein [Bacteroidaceae bacterium]|nr:BACON domain-containing protein [Bacteroidaceae bacterium]
MKKHLIYTLTYTLLACLMLSSCKDDDTIENRIQLKTSATLEVGSEGGELAIKFYSPRDWIVTSNQEWCTLSPEQGVAGDAILTANVEKNLTADLREVVITISSEDLSQDVTILQAVRGDSSTVRVTHTSKTLPLPIVSGYSPVGYIQWGDGNREKYEYQEGYVHQYAQSQEYQVTFNLWGAEEIEFTSLKGISEIDLTEF